MENRNSRLDRRTLAVMCWALSMVIGASGATRAGATGHELGELSSLRLEDLLNVEVVSASRYAQRAADAPAAVTVITPAEIKAFGYRTLADILRAQRGFHVTYDRVYSYAGVRGFAPPGDYNTRLLVLVDGYRTNDALYDAGLIGNEFPIDLDLVERVEVVRGPSSSVYGNNALFGVINVITRRGADIKGLEVAGARSSYDTKDGRVTFGRKLDNGLDFVVSASGLKSGGPTLTFPEFAAINNGVASGTDHERYSKIFAKVAYGPFSLTASHSERNKGTLPGYYGVTFNDPANVWQDRFSFLDLAYYRQWATVEVQARTSYGEYWFNGDNYFPAAPSVLFKDTGTAKWWGADLKGVYTGIARHKIVAGVEYQNNFHLQQLNRDVNPLTVYVDDRQRTTRYGIFLQDEFAFARNWLLNAGLRYDKTTNQDAEVNPRAALIFRPWQQTTVKLLYGTAFRAPNTYEAHYEYPGFQIRNPNLQPEKIRTLEAIVEQRLTARTKLSVSGYRYHMDGLISLVIDPVSGLNQFQNVNSVKADGVEVELDHVSAGGARLRASYTHQVAEDVLGAALQNSPRHLAKVNFATPLFGNRVMLGVEGQFVDKRLTALGETGSYSVGNLTLTWRPAKAGPELSASIYNLFGQRFADPVAFDPNVPTRDVVQQNGRTFRFKLEQRF